ncbi:MAG: hypothetical protein QOE52_3363 [Mycobacterium sp.]|jgi:hypothetical protein|nr:hypothetical protein [Mycobacterium sp.]
MVPERLAWAGSVIMSGVGIYLSYKPIANDLGKGLVVGLAALIILGALLMFPYRRRNADSPGRLISVRVGGRNNRVQTAGDCSTQVIADRDATVHTPGSPGKRQR